MVPSPHPTSATKMVHVQGNSNIYSDLKNKLIKISSLSLETGINKQLTYLRN
jgi:hypothetical protein